MSTETLAQGPAPAVRPSSHLRVEGGSSHDVVARVADFAEVSPAPPGTPGSLDRLMDVNVTVTAELGRINLPVSALLQLGVNSVLELNRSVAEPVDLMVQGVRLARGEVVVVGDCFAVRVKEICEPRQKLGRG
jgi:flagellar motor switch protein FliN/FliY